MFLAVVISRCSHFSPVLRMQYICPGPGVLCSCVLQVCSRCSPVLTMQYICPGPVFLCSCVLQVFLSGQVGRAEVQVNLVGGLHQLL